MLVKVDEIVPFDYDKSSGPPIQSNDLYLPIQPSNSTPVVVEPVNLNLTAASDNFNSSNPAAAADSYLVALLGLYYETNVIGKKDMPLLCV